MARRALSGGRLVLAALVAVGLAATVRAQPNVLDPPLEPPPEPEPAAPLVLPAVQLDPPLGFTGPSGVQPRSGNNAEFQTVEDRWRIGYPFWDRYGQGFPPG